MDVYKHTNVRELFHFILLSLLLYQFDFHIQKQMNGHVLINSFYDKYVEQIF